MCLSHYNGHNHQTSKLCNTTAFLVLTSFKPTALNFTLKGIFKLSFCPSLSGPDNLKDENVLETEK